MLVRVLGAEGTALPPTKKRARLILPKLYETHLCGMMPIRFLISFLAVLSVGCQSAPKAPQNADLEVRLPSPLSAEPTESSLILLEMEKGQALQDLGQTAPNETLLSIGGELVQSPWIMVRTSDGAEGWALAWALKPKGDGSAWLLGKRAECYFGKALAARCAGLRQNFAQARDEQALAAHWAEAALLRDTLLGILSQKPLSATDLRFDWLADLLPGFIAQRQGGLSQPRLFADFGKWAGAAAQTAGTQDDVFFGICSAVFLPDSIESDFPMWKFPLSEGETASQLGAGHHVAAFRLIDKGLAEAPMFRAFWEKMKEQLLADIFGPQIAYWQAQDKILKEMGLLLAQPPKCLDIKEIGAISIRKKMFEAAAENGIKMNLRSGQTGQ
jgi:hypothetical protein